MSALNQGLSNVNNVFLSRPGGKVSGLGGGGFSGGGGGGGGVEVGKIIMYGDFIYSSRI